MSPLHPLQFDPGSALLHAVLCLLGVAALAGAVRNYREHRTVAAATATDVGALSPGPVVVSGTVVPTDEVLSRPFGGGQCVAAAFEIESHMQRRRGTAWQQVDEGTMQVPFLVDDGTGEVLVDDGADLVLADAGAETVEVGGDEPLPAAVERFTEARSVDGGGHLFDAEATRAHDRRYVQRVLTAGDEVTVVGRATADADAPPGTRGYVLRDCADGTFLVGDVDRERLVAARGGWRWRAVVALVLLGAGGWLLAF